jgi:hypothetical protein
MLAYEVNPGVYALWAGERVRNILHDPALVARFWSADDMAAAGIYALTPFVTPAGRRTIGEPSYSMSADGKSVDEVYRTEPIPVPPPTTADLIAYAADARYRRETVGITVNGAAIATDRQSQAMIAGAFTYLQQRPDATIQWKTASGAFVALAAADLAMIAQVVGTHVQACFAKEAEVFAAISAGTVVSMSQIDAAFASPGNAQRDVD